MQHLALTLGLALLSILPSRVLEAATAEEAQLQQFQFNSIDGGRSASGTGPDIRS